MTEHEAQAVTLDAEAAEAAEAAEGAEAAMGDDDLAPIDWRRLTHRWLPLGVGMLAMLLTALLLIPGHSWGDDWALYLRQSEGILHFKVRDVVHDARFTVDKSIGPEFSPRVYPWGTAMLLLIPRALFGRSVAAFKLTEAFALGVGAAAWFAMGRRRMSNSAALAGALCFMISLPLIKWANYVGSDIPYVAVVGVCLAVFARWFANDTLDRRHVVLLGVLGAVAFAFRQEGLTVMVALLAAAAWYRMSRSLTLQSLKSTAGDVGLGVAAFAVVTGVLQVLMPYQMLPSYKGSGGSRISESLTTYLRAAADQFGLWNRDRVEVFNRPRLGWLILIIGLVFVVVGLARMFSRHDALDVAILLVLAAHFYSALTTVHAYGRYLFTAVAALTFVGAQGIHEIAHLAGRVSRKPRAIFALVLVLPLLWIQWPRYQTAAEAATKSREQPVTSGPFGPPAQEMFDKVRELTQPDDVIAFKKARAMTLFTDRLSVQVPYISAVPTFADWFVAEKDKNGDFIAPPFAEEVWRNVNYVIYRLIPTSEP
ncbi:MAG TPA: hypothetical protein PLV13_03775 [Ilumatobacteraceae bacterium]|nr:hypothetical protein [Ilumatobacteraceae bacterium]